MRSVAHQKARAMGGFSFRLIEKIYAHDDGGYDKDGNEYGQIGHVARSDFKGDIFGHGRSSGSANVS